MNYDGTNSSILLQRWPNPLHITARCFQHEDNETIFTIKPSTSEYTKHVDVATAVTDQGDAAIVPGMYE